MLRLVVLSALVAAATALYGAYGGYYGGYNAPLTYAASPLRYSGAYAASPLAYGGAYAASPLAYAGAYAASPLTYAAAPYAAPAAYAAPAPYTYSRRYQSQDEFGRASYGHEEPNQNHAAVRDAFGNVAGSYNYINPEGKTITVKYTAGVEGFKVESNALPEAPVDEKKPPVDMGVAPMPVPPTAEVAAATQAHLAAVAEAEAAAMAAPEGASEGSSEGDSEGNWEERKKRSLTYAAAPLLATSYAALPATTYAAAPAAAGYAAEKTEVILNPGHAVAYRVDPLI